MDACDRTQGISHSEFTEPNDTVSLKMRRESMKRRESGTLPVVNDMTQPAPVLCPKWMS